MHNNPNRAFGHRTDPFSHLLQQEFYPRQFVHLSQRCKFQPTSQPNSLFPSFHLHNCSRRPRLIRESRLLPLAFLVISFNPRRQKHLFQHHRLMHPWLLLLLRLLCSHNPLLADLPAQFLHRCFHPLNTCRSVLFPPSHHHLKMTLVHSSLSRILLPPQIPSHLRGPRQPRLHEQPSMRSPTKQGNATLPPNDVCWITLKMVNRRLVLMRGWMHRNRVPHKKRPRIVHQKKSLIRKKVSSLILCRRT